MSKILFERILVPKDGLIKGPFGGDIKKSLFVPKTHDAYKVYEQGVVLKQDINYGDYYISKEHFEQKLKRFQVKKGDILMTGAGTLGELITVPENAPKGVINQALLRIRLNEEIITSDFFKYYFKYYIKAIISRINGDSVIPNLPPLSIIKNTEIDIPNLNVQEQIAKVLSTLDSKIELNNKINAELEAMAKTIYDYWFVQFDFPNAKGKPYKSIGGKMVWNEELKREIPAGWEVKKMASLTDNISRGISPNYLESGGICVLNQKCIRDNKVIFEFSRRHNDQIKSVNTKKINIHDVLVNSTGVGTLGRVAIVKRLPEDLITVDSHVTIVRANSKEINPVYFGFSLIQKQKEIEGFSVGSTGQVELSRSQLEGINLIAPPDEIQKLFGEMYKSILNRMSICESENEQLASLRDW